jgi:Reverse transcriptase (RNA-dependent DNA polymerase)
MPQGVEHKGQDLRISQSLYGNQRALKLWFKYLRDQLLHLGFNQSTIDHCLFYKPGIVFIVYVDAGIFVAKDQHLINQTIQELHNLRFDLDVEDDYAGYFGISLVREPFGCIHMTQMGLIDCILVDVNLFNSSKTKKVPAAGLLGPCHDSAPFSLPWNYCSVIGKLMYLANSTRCDIAFATHQFARYSNNPR